MVHAHIDIYIYTAVCKNFEPLIYIRIYIYGVHCGKVSILENVPGRKIIINIQPQEDNNTQYIEDITCLSILLWLEVNFLVEPFP